MTLVDKQKWRYFKTAVGSCMGRYSLGEALTWYLQHARRLQRFKDMHKGQACIIIGNGPSINEMDLTQLKDCFTFGLNKIFLLFDKIDLNLSYHVAVNSLVIEQSAEQIESLSCPSFLSYRKGRRLVRQMPHIYLMMTSDGFSFSPSPGRLLNEGRTVTYVAMQIAYFMGFSDVILIGVDHNFTCSGEPNEKQQLSGEDPNHFDSRYFQNSEWQLPDLEASELAYRTAGFYFQRAGRRIFDATINGKLDVFPKISFEHALSICRKTGPG